MRKATFGIASREGGEDIVCVSEVFPGLKARVGSMSDELLDFDLFLLF